MTEPNGPPFTVPRYGSLGEAIIAERDWLKQQNNQLSGTLSLAEEGLANYAQEAERQKPVVDAAVAYVKAWKARGGDIVDEWSALFKAVEGSSEPQSGVCSHK